MRDSYRYTHIFVMAETDPASSLLEAQVLQFCKFLLEKQSHCGNILKEGESEISRFTKFWGT